MPKSYLDQQTLRERVQRAVHYQKEKMPGRGNRDAVNAVLNGIYRGKLSEEKQRERNAYARAMTRELDQLVD